MNLLRTLIGTAQRALNNQISVEKANTSIIRTFIL